MAAMTESSPAADQQEQRYPLSYSQEWFLTMDQGDGGGGTFSSRFTMVDPIHITGVVDLAVLQAALDDVVARHELLRTVVVRDADPPYQHVFPPCRVPLEVTDVPMEAGESRDKILQGLLYETAEISVRQAPLLRARLCRFDDRDSVLIVVVHHSASDAWSQQVVMRDIGAFYAARATGTAAKLPPVRQYHEYAEWQRARATSTAEDGAPAYWRRKLDGAREIAMPNDHGHPASYSRPFSQHVHVIDADVMAGASALAGASRTTLFPVLLSAFYVLAHQVTGATDLTMRAFTAGRDVEEFHNTMGLFLNLVPFRTDIAGCTSFRDIVMRAKDTFIDAIAYELPAAVIEQSFPHTTKPREDLSTSQFVISCPMAALGEDPSYPIAEGARYVRIPWREDEGAQDIPTGIGWFIDLPASGALTGSLMFNPDEFDESTVVGWATSLRRILTAAVRDPDQDWKTL